MFGGGIQRDQWREMGYPFHIKDLSLPLITSENRFPDVFREGGIRREASGVK